MRWITFILLLSFNVYTTPTQACKLLQLLSDELTAAGEEHFLRLGKQESDENIVALPDAVNYQRNFELSYEGRLGALSAEQAKPYQERAKALGVLFVEGDEVGIAIQSASVPVIKVNGKTDQIELETQFARLETFYKLRDQYQAECGDNTCASTFAMAALQTPHGKLAAGSRAEAVLLEWVDLQKQVFSSSGKFDPDHVEELFHHLNLPTLEALETIASHTKRVMGNAHSLERSPNEIRAELLQLRRELVTSLLARNRIYRHYVRYKILEDPETMSRFPNTHTLFTNGDPEIDTFFHRDLKRTDILGEPTLKELYEEIRVHSK